MQVSVSPLETFTHFVEWLAVAQLLESVLSGERTRRLFPLLLLVLPAKLLIAGRTVTWSELAGAVLAYICSYFLSGYQRRAALVAGLIISLLILRGLAPYHRSSVANPFSWIPFSGFLAADPEFGMLTFLRKCFWYGSAIWLLRATGWRLARAAVAVALLLGAIEIIQIHLPGRVAEITDPLLAMMAVILGLSERLQTHAAIPLPAKPQFPPSCLSHGETFTMFTMFTRGATSSSYSSCSRTRSRTPVCLGKNPIANSELLAKIASLLRFVYKLWNFVDIESVCRD